VSDSWRNAEAWLCEISRCSASPCVLPWSRFVCSCEWQRQKQFSLSWVASLFRAYSSFPRLAAAFLVVERRRGFLLVPVTASAIASSPRQSFCRSVHARFGGVSYRPQNAFFLFPCCSPPLRVFRVSVTPSLSRGLAHTDIAVQDRETQGEFRA